MPGGRIFCAAVLSSIVLVALAPAARRDHAPPLRFGPVAHRDGRDTRGPLDLTSVTFGQQDTQLVLMLRTARPWSAGALAALPGRDLCVVLYGVTRSGAVAEICVKPDGGAPSLTVSSLGPGGAPPGRRALRAFVSRPDRRTISAAFTPLSAGLIDGRFAWRAVSHWTDRAACAQPRVCVDDVPDGGPAQDRISLLREPRCFGAAARDPLHPCRNSALRTAVVPTPDEAAITPNAYCGAIVRDGIVSSCAFGASTAEATATFALIGDSHSEQWRGALEVVAQARHWHGLSVTRSSCPFNAARPRLVDAQRTHDCAKWDRAVPRWLRRHPSIRTVITSNDARATFERPARGGYRDEWRELPATVTHVIVIRDTPQIDRPQADCVTRSLARHVPAGVRCAQPRSEDLGDDPAADEARALPSSRVQVVDLTRYMCGRRLCFAVVGGALVRKDGTHLTRVFSTTLGPYLLRAVDRFVP